MITKKSKYLKEKNEDLRTIINCVFLLVFIFGIIGFLIFSNWKINQKRTDLRAKIDVLQEEIEDLKTKKSQLEAGVIEAGQDEYLEEKIREQGYKKPGEKAVVVKKEGEEEITVEEETIFDKILKTFQRD